MVVAGYADDMGSEPGCARRAAQLAAPVAVLALVVAACAGTDSAGSGEGEHSAVASATADTTPDTTRASYGAVLAAELRRASDGTWSVDVTVSSAYDTAERYADGWRVLDDGGDVLGEQELTHDHADEQPFTRTQTGLEIPDSVSTVTIEVHDTENGYGGETLEVDVPTG